MSSAPVHVPVLLERIIAVLSPALTEPGAVLVDATLGLGGHSAAILTRFPDLRLIGLDRDPAALAHSRARLVGFGDRVSLVHARYDELPAVLADLGCSRVQGMLFDLGVSSMQLDADERGFSYSRDTPLDMRMDPSRGITAAEVLNTYSIPDLTRVIRAYGEERFARRIATAIVAARAGAPFTTSPRLVELIRLAIPAPARRTGGNPAKRTFQALRIEVNGELTGLEAVLPAAIEHAALSGRIAVLTYHSLEDRLVKRAFSAGAASSAPVGLPVELPEHAPVLRLLAKGEPPSQDEVDANPRAASARLRAVEKLREGRCA